MKSKLNTIIGILIIIASILWLAIFQKTDDEKFHLYMLDVGQGMAIYIRFPDGFDILYDGGPNSKVLEELGDVMPAWDRQIDLIISSHNHADHITGLIDVLENFEVNEIWISGAIHTTKTYEKFLNAMDESDAKISICNVRAYCHTPNVENGNIEILYPFEDLTGTRPNNQNNASLVARIEYGETSILLPGEIEKDVERNFVEYYCSDDVRAYCNTPLQSDILQSPHQGSKSSSSEIFIDVVDPELILIAVGADNKFGHPHKEVLDRYEVRDIDFFRTDKCDRLEIEADLEDYEIISNCK